MSAAMRPAAGDSWKRVFEVVTPHVAIEIIAPLSIALGARGGDMARNCSRVGATDRQFHRAADYHNRR
jgi:hypothetical protein